MRNAERNTVMAKEQKLGYKKLSISKDGANYSVVVKKIGNENFYGGFSIPNRYMVLYNESKSHKSLKEPGSYINLSTKSKEYSFSESPLSIFEIGKAKRAEEEIKDANKRTPFVVFGCRYEKVNNNYIKTEKKEFCCPSQIRDPDEASKWMLENNPEYYLGCTIRQDTPCGSVTMIANPSYFEQEFGLNGVEEILEYLGNKYGVLVDLDEDRAQAEAENSFVRVPDFVEEEEYDFFEY